MKTIRITTAYANDTGGVGVDDILTMNDNPADRLLAAGHAIPYVSLSGVITDALDAAGIEEITEAPYVAPSGEYVHRFSDENHLIIHNDNGDSFMYQVLKREW